MGHKLSLDGTHSFGYWVRRRRKALDLSQRELAERAACSLSAIKKIEQDTRRPSQQLAELLADCLAISESEREQFLRSARGLSPVDEMSITSRPLKPSVEVRGKTHPVVEGNLSAAVTPIFGRDVEVDRLEEYIAVADNRLITLIGPGGVGKSRLALEAVRQAQPSFRDGAWFVPLAGVDDSAYLSTAIAVALRLNFSGPLAPEQQLIRQLQDRHLLLLLDNFEQLLPDGVEFVFDLIQSLPQLTMLVTSRERLRLQAEVIVPLDGLGLEPARTLFVERAQRAGADLSPVLTVDASDAIDGICRLVGGLPLAIELAAVWVRLLQPAEIFTDLESSFELLTGDKHDLPERHRSMQAVFDASWTRLPLEEQKLLAGLSVFAGSFSRDAAESICRATLSQFATLHDHSLIQRDQERFRLHEVIRLLAAEKLAKTAHELSTVRARHAAHFIDQLGHLSTFLMTGDDRLAGWQLAIEYEMENIHVAWHWVIARGQPQHLLPAIPALWIYLDIRGQVREGVQMIGALGEAVMKALAEGNVDDVTLRRTQAMALVGQGALNLRIGDSERGRKEIRRAASLLDGLDAVKERIIILPWLGLVAIFTGEFGAARREIEEALILARREDQIWGQALSLIFLGLLSLIQGQPKAARDFLNESVTMWSKQAGLTYGKVRALVHLGLAHHALSDFKSAQSIQEEALRLATEIQDFSFMPLSRCNLAFHHYAQDNLELAKVGFDKGLIEAKRLDLFNSVWHSILGLGLVAAAEGQTSKAVTLLTFGLGQPGEYTGFLLDEPQRILADLRSTLPPEEFAAAEDQAREMELADLMAWL